MTIEPLLQLLAEDPDLPIDAAEVALVLASEEYPKLDVPEYVRRLDQMANVVRKRLSGALEVQVLELTQYLFGELGFTGNRDEYYDPRNSHMNEVLDRRLGIPITLSALAVSVGNRAGMTVEGVGLPGHFIAKASDAEGEVLFDPFNDGRLLDESDCEELMAKATGQSYVATRAMLRPARPAEIVARMLNNLKGVYLEKADYVRVIRVTERLRILLPDDPAQERDLGLCMTQVGRHGAALDLLTSYLRKSPDAEDVATIRAVVEHSRNQVAKWN